MRRNGHEIDERELEEIFARLEVEEPAEEMLRRMARSAASQPRVLSRETGRSALRPTLHWSIVAAAAALLAGSGLGFGLGSSVTPSGSAGTSFRGLGFLPAPGWAVVQGGTDDSAGVSRAVAANVPLHPGEGPDRLPMNTIATLPARGVLIHVTFAPRGDPAEDVAYAPRPLPLRIADARPVSRQGSARSELRIRAAVGGFNVEARVYFGRTRPTTGMVAAAQRQLNRLAVAAERVTIRVQPTVIGASEPVTVFGSIDVRRAGELVDIQVKDCGQQFFRGRAGTTTLGDGTWSTLFYPHISTTIRAVWKGNASAPVAVWEQAYVSLARGSGGRLRVRAWGGGSQIFWHKRVVIQQRRSGSWKTVKEVVLTMDGNLGFTYFTISVPRGTLLRAVLPRSQSRPCYLAAVSRTLRT